MLRHLFVGLLIAGAVVSFAAWCISPEMAQNWAFERNGTAESRIDAQSLLWVMRVGAPGVALAGWFALSRWQRTESWLRSVGHELMAVTRISHSGGPLQRTRRGVFRAAVVAWLLLAVVHWADGARRVGRDWPVYKWRAGSQVLPNMSESNRDVIRYLQSATPENARILVTSDQSLYFLSYYLWPRQVFQRRHPDSEFVVPQPGQARQLAAYRLDDLTQEDIDSIDPDYVLEYFEGPEYVDLDRLYDDQRWIAFVRQLRRDRAFVPPCNVRLRSIDEIGSRP